MSHEVIEFNTGTFSLGGVLVASSQKGVAAILLGDDPEKLLEDLKARFPSANIQEGCGRKAAKLLALVVQQVENPTLPLPFPLDERGSEFQLKVWKALRKIPFGAMSSYSEIAEQVGLPKGVRAVANACAANPIAIITPCHRVVRNDGSLSGYYWGIEMKRALLKREGVLI